MNKGLIKLESEIAPIQKCKATSTSLHIPEGTTIEEWGNIGNSLKRFHKANKWWIGDWLNFGEGKYGEMFSQAMDKTELDYQTLQDYKYVSGSIELSVRNNNLSFSHHKIVAPLKPKEQARWLDKAEKEEWDVRKLREEIKKANKQPTPALPEEKYQVIYADPPWEVKAGPGWGEGGESRDLEYPTMTLEEIKNLGVKELAADDAHLYLWTINKYIQESYDVARAWGFEPVCLLTWVKPPHGIGLGGTFVQTTEHLLFCRKGTLEAKKRIDTTWFAYPRGRHSEKPKEIRKMIEEVSPGKKIELFAREKSEGWDVWGNEV